MVDPADRRGRERVDAFLDGIGASVYHTPVRAHESLRDNEGDSQSLTGSHGAVIDPSPRARTASGQSLTVSSDRAEEVVKEMVSELAEDIDHAVAIGADMPFTGADLRRFYVELLSRHPVVQVLADVNRRWKAQVVGDVLLLEFKDLKSAAIEDDRHQPRRVETGKEGGGDGRL